MENIHDTSFGRTSPEHSAAITETTSFQCCEPSQKSATPSFMSLDLRVRGIPIDLIGSELEPSWETDSASHGEQLTLNTGESPSVVVDCTLSQILEDTVPQKYYLSAKACQGILRRAERRGKELPPMLKAALEQMIERSYASSLGQ